MFLNTKLLKRCLIFIGLIQFTAIRPMEIKLSSKVSDRKEFTVNKKMITDLSGLVKSALESDSATTEIPLPGVASRELQFITDHLDTLYKINQSKTTEAEKQEQIDKNLSDKLPNRDDELIELINAANYMDIPLLLNYLIAKLVKDKKDLIKRLNPVLQGAVEKYKNKLGQEIFDIIKNLKSENNEVTAKIQDLLKSGANVDAKNKDQMTALILAAFKGFPNIVNILLESGANVNSQTAIGNTPVISTIMGYFMNSKVEIKEFIETLKLLLKKGANVNIANKAGLTPLHYLLTGDKGQYIGKDHKGKKELFILLLEAKADVNAKDSKGNTPLMYEFDPAFIRVLLDAKADPNIKNNLGETALMLNLLATNINKMFERIDLLIKGGADFNAVDNKGNSVFHYAYQFYSKHPNEGLLVLALFKGKVKDEEFVKYEI